MNINFQQLLTWLIPVAIVLILARIVVKLPYFSSKFKVISLEAYSITEPDKKAELVEKNILRSIEIFDRMAITLHIAYIILGATAIVSSVLVTTFISEKCSAPTGYMPFVSFTATTSITLITAFGLGPKSNNCRNACRHLVYYYSLYKIGKIDLAHLLKAMSEAEKMIGGVDFTYKPE